MPSKRTSERIIYVTGSSDSICSEFSSIYDDLEDRFPHVCGACGAADRKTIVMNTVHYIAKELRHGSLACIRAGKLRAIYVIVNRMDYANPCPIDFTEEVTRAISANELHARHNTQDRTNGHNSNKKAKQRATFPTSKYWYGKGILCTMEGDVTNGFSSSMFGEYIDLFDRAAESCFFDEMSVQPPFPDTDFVLNKRDCPVFTKDGTHPYAHALAPCDRATARVPSTSPRLAALSIYTGQSWCDQPIVEPIAKLRVMPRIVDWNRKRSTALFRGSSTQAGSDICTNTRLELCTVLSPLLDCAITAWSKRIKVLYGRANIQHRLYNCGTRIPVTRWSEWKYQIYVKGHSAALRMRELLCTNSVIIKISTEQSDDMPCDSLWYFESHMKAFPKCDLKIANHIAWPAHKITELPRLVRWLIKNDDIARRIADNAHSLSVKLTDEKYICDELRKQVSYTTSDNIIRVEKKHEV